MIITFPTLLSLDDEIAGNPIRQLSQRTAAVDGTCAPFTNGRLRGFLLQSDGKGETLVLPEVKHVPDHHVRVIESDAVPADGVRHEEEVKDLVDKIIARFGRLDIAVNNAGTVGTPGSAADVTPESYQEIFVSDAGVGLPPKPLGMPGRQDAGALALD